MKNSAKENIYVWNVNETLLDVNSSVVRDEVAVAQEQIIY